MMFSLSISASAFLPIDYRELFICAGALEPQSIRLVVMPSAARRSAEELADDLLEPIHCSPPHDSDNPVDAAGAGRFDIHVCCADGECKELNPIPLQAGETIVIHRGKPAVHDSLCLPIVG